MREEGVEILQMLELEALGRDGDDMEEGGR
jgi:hypothetical protein